MASSSSRWNTLIAEQDRRHQPEDIIRVGSIVSPSDELKQALHLERIASVYGPEHALSDQPLPAPPTPGPLMEAVAVNPGGFEPKELDAFNRARNEDRARSDWGDEPTTTTMDDSNDHVTPPPWAGVARQRRVRDILNEHAADVFAQEALGFMDSIETKRIQHMRELIAARTMDWELVHAWMWPPPGVPSFHLTPLEEKTIPYWLHPDAFAGERQAGPIIPGDDWACFDPIRVEKLRSSVPHVFTTPPQVVYTRITPYCGGSDPVAIVSMVYNGGAKVVRKKKKRIYYYSQT